MSEIETLKYKKLDLEPDEVPPIMVELGTESYKAHCPNDYEFIALISEVRKLQEDAGSISITPILSAFFSPHDVRQIDRKCRSGKIMFIEELAPAMNALADHYKPFVEKRLDQVQKKLSSPKAG